MIQIVIGNIFESECKFLVNPVNCVGIMGAGLAKEFKQRYPIYYDHYLYVCRKKYLKLGEPTYYHSLTDKEKCVISFPTKNHWQDRSRIEDIEAGLKYIADNWILASMAFPAIGCGLGGLKFDDVLPLFKKYLNDWPELIEIYRPK